MIAEIGLNIRGAVTYGSLSIAFGTVINIFVPPRVGLYTRVIEAVYTAAGTAHTLTFLRPIGMTTTTVAGATGQAVLTLTAQPAISYGGAANDVAANDWMAWENSDGTFSFDKVASVSGLAITMTSNLPKAVIAGAKVWFFGIITDVNIDSYAHPRNPAPASATTNIINTSLTGIGVASTLRQYEPMLVQSNNITATGTFERVNVSYTVR